MDSLSPERRSWNMSRIRGKDTRPELFVRSLLHQLGYRFRLNRKEVPGKPDIVLPKYRTAVYVHGCFWHRHEGCTLAYTPKSNLEFWKKKFARNVERDAEVASKLRETGWKQMVIWECEMRDPAVLSRRIRRSLPK
jgi:DNA mismatch endonuclease (patch repair protein)